MSNKPVTLPHGLPYTVEAPCLDNPTLSLRCELMGGQPCVGVYSAELGTPAHQEASLRLSPESLREVGIWSLIHGAVPVVTRGGKLVCWECNEPLAAIASTEALDHLTWLFAEHGNHPRGQFNLRKDIQEVLDSVVTAERLRIADELERQAQACNGSARFALQGVAAQLRGAPSAVAAKPAHGPPDAVTAGRLRNALKGLPDDAPVTLDGADDLPELFIRFLWRAENELTLLVKAVSP